MGMSVAKRAINEMGLKVGDTVKVVRTWPFEIGWASGWTSAMDKYVGQEAKITDIDEDGDIHLDDDFYFPVFSLEKVVPVYTKVIVNRSSYRLTEEELKEIEDLADTYDREKN